MSDVSRETPDGVEAEPPVAVSVFGDRIDLARRFAAALTAHGEERGLIGPSELPRLWTRHVLNSAAPAPLFRGRVADLGSGAGLPGIVLAICRPDVQWVLIEPMERRTIWLQEQIDELGLTNATVWRGRAQEWTEGRSFDMVTARAVSALKTLLPMSVPLVRVGGELAFLKGASAPAEIEAARKQIARLGLEDVRVEEVIAGTESTRVVRATVTR